MSVPLDPKPRLKFREEVTVQRAVSVPIHMEGSPGFVVHSGVLPTSGYNYSVVWFPYKGECHYMLQHELTRTGGKATWWQILRARLAWWYSL